MAKLKAGVDVDTLLAGFLADPSYTYTDSRINFTMDGVLPAVLVDAHAVGYVEYAGDGKDISTRVNDDVIEPLFTAFGSRGNIKVAGLSKGDLVRVFSMTGRVVYQEQVHTSSLNIALSKGIYLVQSQGRVAKVLVQ